MKLRTLVLTALLAFTVASCSYGVATYSIKPIQLSDKSTLCCEVTVSNGKEIQSLNLTVVKTADGSYALTLNEEGVTAFAGQQVATSAVNNAAAVTAGVLLKSVVP